MPPEPNSPRLDDSVLAGLQARNEAVALTDGEHELSGAAAVSRVAEFAARIRDAGATPGEALLVAVDNRADDVICQLAVWQANCVAIPVHRGSPAMVVAETAVRSGARMMVGDVPTLWADLLTAASSGPGALHSLNVELTTRPAELDSDQALVIFTSGSTGRPKGVVISHRAFATKLSVNEAVLGFAAGDTMLQVLHLHFSFGQWTSLLTLATAGRLDLVHRYDTDAVLGSLSEGAGYDRIAVVPTMMRMIASRLTDPDGPALLDRLRVARSPRLWIAGGEPLAGGLGERFKLLLPDSGIADVFGLSESATSDFIVTPADYDARAGSIGLPAPGVEARLVVDTGSDGFVDPADGEVGELWLRTPHLMTGYLADPGETARAISGEWLRTGDLARVREDGAFELVGRAKTLILRGGVKVSPLEIENVYTAHPDCSGVIAIGIPDDILGERIYLLVTARAGRTVDEDEVRKWGRSLLDPSKLPDTVRVIDELPLGVTGKTDRLAARRDLLAALAQSR